MSKNTFIEFSPIVKDKEFIKQLLKEVEYKCLTGHYNAIDGTHYCTDETFELEGWHIEYSAILHEDNSIEFCEINFSPVHIEPFNQLYT